MVSQNVAATIGVPYELIAIDNSAGKYGICEAYNIGARQSQYEVLCFMHEDIAFHTPDWGQVVIDVLADSSIGVLGVAGGMYQLGVPSGWWSVYEHLRMQVIQTTPDYPRNLDVVNPQQEELADVAAVDGLWMCSRKTVWQQHPFDEATFPAFHFYDLDYCTQVFQRLRVCVTFRVLIEHFSTGSINEGWLQAALLYQRKWRAHLPFGVVEVSKLQRKRIEQRVFAEFVERVLQSKLSNWAVLKVLGSLLANNQLSQENLGMVKRFVLKRGLGKDLKKLYAA